MSSQHKSQYSDEISSEESLEQQLIKEQFLQIFQEGVDPNKCFYKAYSFRQSNNLLNQIQTISQENKQLEKKAKQTGKSTITKQQQTSQEQRKKRARRTAGQIARHYICNYSSCQKSYGSEGSLNQHIKLKHNGIPFSK